MNKKWWALFVFPNSTRRQAPCSFSFAPKMKSVVVFKRDKISTSTRTFFWENCWQLKLDICQSITCIFFNYRIKFTWTTSRIAALGHSINKSRYARVLSCPLSLKLEHVLPPTVYSVYFCILICIRIFLNGMERLVFTVLFLKFSKILLRIYFYREEWNKLFIRYCIIV